MKKHLFRIFILTVMCILSLSMLISCVSTVPDNDTDNTGSEGGESNSNDQTNVPPPGSFEAMNSEDKALYILNAEGATKIVNSCTVLNYAYFSATISGVEVNMTSSGTTSMRHLNTIKDLIYKDELTTTYTINNQSITYYSQTTFDDGKMGLLESDGEITHAFWSYADQQSFLNYAMPTSSYEITKENCRNIICTSSFDGGYTATFSGFTDEGLEQFEELLNSLKRLIDVELKDVRLTIIVDKELTPTELSMDLTFEQGEELRAPVMKVTANYQGINSTTNVSVDINDYTEVKDLRFLYDNMDAIDYAKYSKMLKLDYNSRLCVTSEVEEIVNEKEKTIVTVSDNPLGYTFGITTTTSDGTFTHSYGNGTLTTIYPTGRQVKNPITTPNARLSVDSYVDIASLSALTMEDIIFDGKTYTITLANIDISAYYELIDILGFTVNDITNVKATLSTEISDGALNNYSYMLTISLNGGYKISLVSYCYFYYE